MQNVPLSCAILQSQLTLYSQPLLVYCHCPEMYTSITLLCHWQARHLPSTAGSGTPPGFQEPALGAIDEVKDNIDEVKGSIDHQDDGGSHQEGCSSRHEAAIPSVVVRV